MRQKRQTLGMVQASDRPGKPRSLDLRPGSATSKGRELHGKSIILAIYFLLLIYFVFVGYDGPLQYAMSGGNPDSIVSLHSNNGLSNEDIDTLNLETVVEELNIGMEDEESTPVAPQTPDTDLSSSIAPAAELPNFNHTIAKVNKYFFF